MPQFDIRAFDPSTMKSDATVLMIGKRGTGKSTLIADIMYHNKDKFKFGIGMSSTDESSGDLSRIMPRSCIFNQFSERGVKRLLALQKKRGKKTGLDNMFIIMDDCAYDRKTLANNSIREVFMNGRHYKLFIINAVQYMMDIPTYLRGQIDYVFATRDNIIDQREKLYRFFFGMFKDYTTFSSVMDSCTNGFDCIVLDATARSNNPSDCVFWYKGSPDIPSYRLCDDVFWKLDEYFYNDPDEDELFGDKEVTVKKLKSGKSTST